MTPKQLINELVTCFNKYGNGSFEEFFYNFIHEDCESDELVLAYEIGLDNLYQKCKEELVIRTASFKRIKPGHYSFTKGTNSGEIVKYPNYWWLWYVDDCGNYATTGVKTLRKAKFELASVTE